MLENLDASITLASPAIVHVAENSEVCDSTNAADSRFRCADLRIDSNTAAVLRCPSCNGTYPASKGVPILVDPSKSLFDIETFTDEEATFFRDCFPFR